MARAGGKYSVKGTRFDDVIVVGTSGYTVNGASKSLSASQVAAGLIINADAGNDIVVGGSGPDEINGGRGNDRLTGSGGFDKLLGGDGDDTLIDLDELLIDPNPADTFDPNADRGAIFDGGRGIDTVDFTGYSASLAIDLMNGSINPGLTYQDGIYGPFWTEDSAQLLEGRILNVENAIGGSGNDRIWGNWLDNELHGGDGHDQLFGGDRSITSGSNDRLFGGAGNDVLFGGSGNDWLDGGLDADVFVFGTTPDSIEGHDTIADYEQSVDRIAFNYGQTGPSSWTPIDTDGDLIDDALYGTYDGGQSSLTIIGVTDVSQLTIVYSANDWPF